MSQLNATDAPELRSRVESANRAGHSFPIQNLPYGIFRRAGSHEPYRVPWTRAAGDPLPLAYLDHPALYLDGAFDAQLKVCLQTAFMQERGIAAQRLSLSNFRDAYWCVSQLLAHHTAGGCNLRPGDWLGSGTQSGPQPDAAGSLLELTGGGKREITLAGGEQRRFLANDDAVIMRGWAQRDGHPCIALAK